MQELETLLEQHDWHYERSDDMRVWRSGAESTKQIHAVMAKLGNTPEVIKLYEQYKPF